MRTWFVVLPCLVLVACTSEVVMLEPTAETRAALCALPPGADVCARNFGGEAGAELVVRTVVQDVVTLAGVARRARSEVEQACEELLSATGAPRTSGPAACVQAEAAMRALRASGALSAVTVDPSTCREELEPVPRCSSLATTQTVTRLCQVRVALDGRDQAGIEAALMRLERVRTAMENAVALSSGISANVQSLGSLRAECVPEVTSLAAQAVTDLGEAIQASAAVRSAVGDASPQP